MIVVKAGGRVIKNNFEQLISSLVKYNEKVVFVHGGGDIVTEYSKRMGVEPVFVTSPEGIRSRYTSKEELEVFIMVMNLINKRIVTGLVSKGKRAVGITGADGPSVLAQRKKKIVIIDERGRKRIIEGGYTGKITQVNSDYILQLASNVDAVVVAPLAVDLEENTLLNVDGDQMAFSISKALKADALVFLTDVDGVLVDGKVVPRLTVEEAKELSKKVGAGMNRKIMMAAEAVEAGVGRVIISSGKVDDAINNALKGNGTVIA